MINKRAQGKANRAKGLKFERETRAYLEREGWIVDKWSNNIDLEKDQIVAAGVHYIPGRGMMPGLGFPDFVMFKLAQWENSTTYSLQFVECKTNNKLTKLEKQKLDWLVRKGYKCFVAYLDEKEIKFREFLEYKESSSANRKET